MDHIYRGHVHPYALPDGAWFGAGPYDPQMASGKPGERAVVVAALDTGLDQVGVADLDPDDGFVLRVPGQVCECFMHGLLKGTEPKHGGRAGRAGLRLQVGRLG